VRQSPSGQDNERSNERRPPPAVLQVELQALGVESQGARRVRRVPVSGVYAILGPNGVYVGESRDCWKRGTLATAILLGLECGIIRETPQVSRLARIRVEAEVAKLFQSRGMPVVSQYLNYAFPDQYAGLRVHHPSRSQPKVTEVQHLADRIVIRTSPRRASAILQVLAGASLKEVGDEMGLSRERVRQYMKDAELSAPKVRKRMKTTSQETRDRFSNRGRVQREARAKQKERVERWVPWIQGFVAREGRAPKYWELAVAIGLRLKRTPGKNGGWGTTAGAMLIGFFSRHSHNTQHRSVRVLHAIYRMAGTQVNKAGSPSRLERRGAA
jgi:predicted transcriptional regulator